MSENIDQIKNKLFRLFTYYANFGEKTNFHSLKSHKFMKMMADSEIKNDATCITSTNLDLLFFSKTKHHPHMNFQDFLDIIPKLAQQKYESHPQNQAFKEILSLNLIPLADKIITDSQRGVEKYLSLEIDEITIEILEHVSPVLFKIYIAYFEWESKIFKEKSQIILKSQKAIYSFAKDYEISPPLLSKSTIFAIFNNVVNLDHSQLTCSEKTTSLIPFLKHDIGTYFTFSRFCALLIRCAYLLYSNYFLDSNQEYSNAERFVYLLEMMELSQGFQKFEKKLSSTHTSKNSLLIPRKKLFQILNKLEQKNPTQSNEYIDANNPNSFFIHCANENSPFKQQKKVEITQEEEKITLIENNTEEIEEKKQKNSFLLNEPIFDLLLPTQNFLEANQNNLLKIFQFYCSIGDPMNTEKMKSIKFQKLLKDACIINKKESTSSETQPIEFSKENIGDNLAKLNRFLSPIDSDLIFSKINGLKRNFSEKKITYDQSLATPNFENKEFYSPSSTTHGKLEFYGFIKALEMICKKIYPEINLDISLNFIWNNHLSILLMTLEKNQSTERAINSHQIDTLTNLLQDPNTIDVLSLIHKPIMIYYKFYCAKSGLMNFSGFLKFCKDFQIFPDLLTKAKLLRIFYSLSQLFKSPSYNEKLINISSSKEKIESSNLNIIKEGGDEFIDSMLFVQSLALCGLEIYFSDPQPSELEKVLTQEF